MGANQVLLWRCITDPNSKSTPHTVPEILGGRDVLLPPICFMPGVDGYLRRVKKVMVIKVLFGISKELIGKVLFYFQFATH